MSMTRTRSIGDILPLAEQRLEHPDLYRYDVVGPWDTESRLLARSLTRETVTVGQVTNGEFQLATLHYDDLDAMRLDDSGDLHDRSGRWEVTGETSAPVGKMGGRPSHEIRVRQSRSDGEYEILLTRVDACELVAHFGLVPDDD